MPLATFLGGSWLAVLILSLAIFAGLVVLSARLLARKAGRERVRRDRDEQSEADVSR